MALEHSIDHAVAGLQVAETQTFKAAERDHLSTAWRTLVKHKSAWSDQYPISLLEAFNAGISTTARAALMSDGIFVSEPAKKVSASAVGTYSVLDSLSLVADADVTQAIESSRLLQQILPAVEQPLAELDKLISSAQGLGNVRPELNPLRPEIFATTLREVIYATSADAAISSLWIRHLAPALGRELKQVYERAVNQLELANVQEAGYRLVQTPAGAGGGRGDRTGGLTGQTEITEAQRQNENSAPGDTQRLNEAGIASKSGSPFGRVAGNGQSSLGYLSDEAVARKPVHYADLSRDSINGELFKKFLVSDYGGHQGGQESNDDHGLAPAYYDNIEEELRALKALPDSVLRSIDSAALNQHDVAVPAIPTTPSGYRELPAVDRPQRPVHEGSQLSEKLWGVFGRHKERAIVRTELKKKASRVGQVMGLELVRKLVNEVAQDPRLLTPVREAIVALEPSLLRLAMVDPRFLKDEAHPGRRLMDRVAQRSFKYNDEFATEFAAFFEPVQQSFNALNKLTIESKEPFNSKLTGLEDGWHAQDESEALHRDAVLQALRFAEQRQVEADRIAFDLSERTDLDDVPGLVLDFLFGPWSLAMAHARLLDSRNQIDPQSLGLVVPDLIWSSKRSMTLKQPAKLIEMIPSLLARLHAGLALLGQDTRENEPFFEGLMRLHQPVLKLRRLKSQRDAEESFSAPLEPEAMPATPEQRRAKAAAQPWLGRQELEAAGFEDTLPSEQGDLGDVNHALSATAATEVPLSGNKAMPMGSTDRAEPSASSVFLPASTWSPNDGRGPVAGADTPLTADSAASEAEITLLSLRTGSWVDLFSKKRWLRAQLIWASSNATLFMFISHGGRAHSMTKRSCERLIAERLLRPVNSQGVVAMALDAVISQAIPAGHGDSSEAQAWLKSS